MSDQLKVVEVNLHQARVLLKMMLREKPRRVTADLQGDAGIGKTTIVRELEDSTTKVIFVPTAAVIAEPGDISGMPKVENGRTVYASPYWSVQANEYAAEYETVIILLDDYNRLPAQILQSLMPVFLDYKVGMLDLKPNVRVVLTSNPTKSDKYATRNLDFAQMERIQTLHVKYDHKITMDYARRNLWVPEWVAFLSLYKEVLGVGGLGISPRTAEFANQALQNILDSGQSLTHELSQLRLDANIGPIHRSTFITCLKTQEKIIEPDDILAGTYNTNKFMAMKKAPDIINLTYSRLASRLHELGTSVKGVAFGNIRKFMLAHESDELTFVFLKSLPDATALNILDGESMREIRSRIYDEVKASG
jgi:hypothetical protein